MKKLLAVMLSLAMLLGTVSAFADEAIYTALYSGEVSTLNYLIASTEWDQTVAANIIDTLVEYDNHGNVIPCLAEDWSVSDDGLTWTFNLRQGVMWYDCDGNEVAPVTANDFVAAMKYILTPEYESAIESTVESAQIVNAAAYFRGEVTDFSQVGVKAADDYTLVYTLATPVPYFLSMVTYGSFMPAYGPLLEQLGSSFGVDNASVYYCGAFILQEFEPQVGHTYVKNEKYWDAEHVYLDGIERIYNGEAGTIAPIMAQRGEVSAADLSSDILDDWKANNPELVTRGRSNLQYSYFYCFDFAPQYEEEYDPANWTIAVNNSNFRHSIMSAFDRIYSMSAEDSDPASLINDAITPAGFAAVNGVDFTALPAFASTAANFTDTAAALAYKAAAIEELTAAGCTFPVTVVLTYKVSDSDWEAEATLWKSQLESVLGTDYINVVLYAGPSDSFLGQTRRAGKYSVMKCNWGADYADPETWTDPFTYGNSYNFMDKALETGSDETKAILAAYYAKVDEAKAETNDTAVRYALFAEAEAMLIDNALVIPYRRSIAGYQVTKLDVYEGEYAPFGLCNLRFKFQHLNDEFVTAEQNAASYEAWQAK